MSKPFKVKRYNHIYRGRRSSASIILRSVGALAVLLVLGFIGWSAYEPVKDFLSGVRPEPKSKPVSVSSAGSSANGEIDAAVKPENTVQTPEQMLSPVKGIYLTTEVISDPVKLKTVLDSLSSSEINAVMFDLKDEHGNVLYQSKAPLVEQAESCVENAYDLAAVCSELSARNLMPVGRLNAFRDPLAASRIPDAGVRYGESKMLWLDNAPESGGKPWLNPYSDLAQAYITDIAAESTSLGVKRVMLDNVSFPTGYGQELAFYGSKSTAITRSEILAAFIDRIDQQVSELGGELNVYISGLAAIGATNTYYGSNPLSLANSDVTIGVMPALFGDGYTLENFSVTEPVSHPQETVDALLKFLAPDIGGKSVTCLLQGYTADYTIKHNYTYTRDDINKQIAALSNNGLESFIIFSPNGSYPQS